MLETLEKWYKKYQTLPLRLLYLFYKLFIKILFRDNVIEVETISRKDNF